MKKKSDCLVNPEDTQLANQCRFCLVLFSNDLMESTIEEIDYVDVNSATDSLAVGFLL